MLGIPPAVLLSQTITKLHWIVIIQLRELKVKVVHTRLPSVGFRSWSRFLAVSLQVTWVINPAVGCHYFPPGPQLPSQPLRGCYQFRCLVNRGTMGVTSLPKTVTRQRRGCGLNPGPTVPEYSTLTTRLLSQPSFHILQNWNYPHGLSQLSLVGVA